MTKIMEYKIVEATTRQELTGCVNSLILCGWRPYGIPFFINNDPMTKESMLHSWNQTMVRLSVKDEEEVDPGWIELGE